MPRNRNPTPALTQAELDARAQRSLRAALDLVDRLEREVSKNPLTVSAASGRAIAHPGLQSLALARRDLERLRRAMVPQGDTQRHARVAAATSAQTAMRAYLEQAYERDDPSGDLLARPDPGDEEGWRRLVEHGLQRARAGQLPGYDGPK